jgi:hypothetical protein
MSRQRPIQCEGHVLRQGDCQEQSSSLELTAGIISGSSLFSAESQTQFEKVPCVPGNPKGIESISPGLRLAAP